MTNKWSRLLFCVILVPEMTKGRTVRVPPFNIHRTCF